jgi:Cdc6-like AAA superfamily ATPase
VYVDPVQRRARWKLVAVGARKKLNNGRRAAKLAQRRSAETAKKLKKHRNRQKSNTAKYQTKTRMEEAGDEKKGRGHRV